MFQLDPARYGQVRPLMQPLLARHVILKSVLDGTSPAQIYVNTVDSPTSAYLHSAEGQFLLGDAADTTFTVALGDWLTTTYFSGTVPDPHYNQLTLTCHPHDWVQVLPALLPSHVPFVGERRYYLFGTLKVEWHQLLPPDFTLHPIDAALLQIHDRRNYDEIAFWIEKNWGTTENFLQRGFGFVILHDDTIVSWCLADGVSGDHCEIGIETDGDYRRRGLATAVVAATVEHALSRGLTRIGWNCWNFNEGSIAVAEKVGFRQATFYPVYSALFDLSEHYGAQGWRYLNVDDYANAAPWYARVLQEPNPPLWAYTQMARIQTHLGHHTAALTYLHRAITAGWRNPEVLESTADFAPLRDYVGWYSLTALLHNE